MIDNRKNANAFPKLTESGFARMACSVRRMLGDKQLIKAVRVTHAPPVYRAEYDRIFGVPVVFESDKNAMRSSAGPGQVRGSIWVWKVHKGLGT